MISNLLDRMKFPFRKNKEFLTALYDILGFYPHRIEVYRIAFSHKSINYTFDKEKKQYRKPNKPRSDYTARPINNERLEFLGDAVIETVVSDILFRHFEHKREGFLTSTRSKIVQREALNRLATDMGLDRLIQAAQGTDTVHTNIGGNAFEALMGAIYLDRGYKHCHWFISNRIIGHYVDLDNVAQKEVNFKSKLLEWSQKNRISINYRDFSRKNEGKGFGTVLTIEGITVSRGEGRSKKESQQEASKEALTRMRRDDSFYDSLFRAKEKRTAMEAEESFALPKIEEIEKELTKTPSQKSKTKAKPPVLEERRKHATEELSEEAYDAAYDENADYEVIDTPPEEHLLTAADYAAKGLPAPPEANDIEDDEEKMRHSHQRKSAANESAKGKAETRKPKKERQEDAPKPRKKEAQKPTNESQEAPKSVPAEKPAAPAKDKKPNKQDNFSDGFIIVEDIHDVVPKDEKPEKEEVSVPSEPQKAVAPQVTEERKEEKTEKVVATTETAAKEEAAMEEEAPAKASEKPAEAPRAKTETLEKPAKAPEKPAEAPRAKAQAPAPAPQLFDDTDFGIFEVDNLPDITGNDEPEEIIPEAPVEKEEPLPVPEEEEETDLAEEEEEAEDNEEAVSPVRTTSASDSAIRPQLRHISLDDFVFGIDPDENEPFDDDELAATELPPVKSQKPHRRKRKPAPALTEEETQNNTNGNNPNKPQNRRKSHPQKKQTHTEGSEGADESNKKPAPKRRRRQPSSNGEQNAAE